MNNEVLSKFKNIKAFFFDVDGVLTDGTVLVTERGEQLRTMSIKDGYALKDAVNKGFLVAIISGGNSQGVAKRLQGLGVTDIFLGQEDKVEAFESLLAKYELTPEQVLYMGDDIPDAKVLKKVGLATCPSNAAEEIQEVCHFISQHEGGKGCAREVIEKVLKLQQLWA